MATKKLTIEQIKTVKKEYNGTWQSILNLSYDFRVTTNVISYLVNHKGAKEKSDKDSVNYRKTHPRKVKKLSRKWYWKNRNKVLQKCKDKYWANIKESRRKGRERYHKTNV